MSKPTLLLVRQASPIFGQNSQFIRSRIAKRAFLNASSTPLTLHATRTLPYPTSDLYRLISDISQYPSFIPYCTGAKIVDWSNKDTTTNTSWPAAATLTIGYGNLSEEYLSKVYCVPNTIVEAISGDAKTSLPTSDLAHYEGLHSNEIRTQNMLFTSLRTRWSLKGYEHKPGDKHPDVQSGKAHPAEVSVESIPSEPRTDVSLVIEIVWKNPIYAATSQALAPSVAGKIVEAFEKRAGKVLGSK